MGLWNHSGKAKNCKHLECDGWGPVIYNYWRGAKEFLIARDSCIEKV